MKEYVVKEGSRFADPVLIILSSEDKLTLESGRRLRTGYYLNELAVPLFRLIESGYNPVFANPKGNVPAMDPRSDSSIWFKGRREERELAKSLIRSLEGFRHPKTFAQVLSEGVDRYAGVFVPGGHAPMEDLCRNRMLGRILGHFHEERKPTAMICHGPVSLISLLDNPDAFLNVLERGMRDVAASFAAKWPYRGYRMTVFSNFEEKCFQLLKLLSGPRGKLRFYAEDALRVCGAQVEPGVLENLQLDRELITAQGPLVDEQLAAAFVLALKERRYPGMRWSGPRTA